MKNMKKPKGSPVSDIYISRPKNFKHGLHVGVDDDTNEMTGLPDAWNINSIKMDGDSTIPSVIAPKPSDLAMLKRAEEPRKKLKVKHVAPAKRLPMAPARGVSMRRPKQRKSASDGTSGSLDALTLDEIKDIYCEREDVVSEKDQSAEHTAERRISEATHGFSLSSLFISDFDTKARLFTRHQYQSVKWVDLSHNKLTDFPEILAVFDNIQKLELRGNKIRECPLALGHLKGLTHLDLSGNNVSQISEAIGYCQNLQILNLSNNAISEIPASIGYLTVLEELRLSGNRLGGIPTTIGHMKYLEVVDLNGCDLDSLPEQLTCCYRVLELNLGNNRLAQLPRFMGGMTRLCDLTLSDNKLNDLPVSMGLINSLDLCQAAGNNFSGVLQTKINTGVDHLVEFLQTRMAMLVDLAPDDFLKKIDKKRPKPPPLAALPTLPDKPVVASTGPTKHALAEPPAQKPQEGRDTAKRRSQYENARRMREMLAGTTEETPGTSPTAAPKKEGVYPGYGKKIEAAPLGNSSPSVIGLNNGQQRPVSFKGATTAQQGGSNIQKQQPTRHSHNPNHKPQSMPNLFGKGLPQLPSQNRVKGAGQQSPVSRRSEQSGKPKQKHMPIRRTILQNIHTLPANENDDSPPQTKQVARNSTPQSSPTQRKAGPEQTSSAKIKKIKQISHDLMRKTQEMLNSLAQHSKGFTTNSDTLVLGRKARDLQPILLRLKDMLSPQVALINEKWITLGPLHGNKMQILKLTLSTIFANGIIIIEGLRISIESETEVNALAKLVAQLKSVYTIVAAK
eukprot:TRINITY_DN5339_c0_g1_i1.p1 TRINITY_DN5339_c0_g1~~TRINITY_DN5339_c0_g1_i1.p1  ORF type:complete len:790 (-),score=123.42 TRINITY_DN5339_c0_g1_i1:52-2421(-)